MDPTTKGLLDALSVDFMADVKQAIARRRDDSDHARARLRDDTDLAIARQRDGASYDARQLQGFITGTLFQSDDPERAMAFNTAARIPTTLDHPNAVVNK